MKKARPVPGITEVRVSTTGLVFCKRMPQDDPRSEVNPAAARLSCAHGHAAALPG